METEYEKFKAIVKRTEEKIKFPSHLPMQHSYYRASHSVDRAIFRDVYDQHGFVEGLFNRVVADLTIYALRSYCVASQIFLQNDNMPMDLVKWEVKPEISHMGSVFSVSIGVEVVAAEYKRGGAE